jgi:hypothetical protein
MSQPMMPTDDERAVRDLALKRVKDRRDFQGHLVVYLVVNGFLWLLWAFTSGMDLGNPWPIWVTLGWGIGVVINWWSVTRRPITESDVEREVKRLKAG